MTRPPSGEWPSGPARPDGTDGENLLSADTLRLIEAELARDARPAPVALREWVAAAAAAERMGPAGDLHRHDLNGRTPSIRHSTAIHRPTALAREQEEDVMSARNPAAARLATLPASARPAASFRPAASTRRRGSLAQRWNRHGWPIVELVGAAVLIIGLVSVMIGGSGNGGSGLPGLLPGYGNVQEATPTVDPDAVAMAQGNAGRTGEMPGPGVASDPALKWRLPVDVQDTFGAPIPTSVQAPVLAVDGMVLYVERQSTQGAPAGSPLIDVTLHMVDAVTADERWSTSFSGVFQGQPLIADGLVIVAVDPSDGTLAPNGGTPDPDEPVDQARGYVMAFDASTGEDRWRTTVGLVGYQDPVYADGLVFVMDRDGYVHGLDSQSGELRWSSVNVPSTFAISYGPSDPLSTSVAVAGGVVIVSSFSGFTYAFHLDSGDVAWYWPADTGSARDDYGSGFQSKTLDPVVSGDTVFLATNRNNGKSVLAAVDLQTGQERWARETDGYEPTPVTVADGVAILTVGPYNGLKLQAVDVAFGRDVLWEVPVAFVGDPLPTIANGIVYLGSADSSVRAIDLKTGEVLWTVRTGGAIASPVYADDGAVYFMSQDDWLYAVGASDAAPFAIAEAGEVDISGLPSCDVDPRPVVYATPIPNDTTGIPTVQLPDATPRATLSDLSVVVGQTQTQAPAIAWGAIPSGTSVTPEQADGIASTLERMLSCSRPGNGSYIAAFYTDDYFLRPWVVWELAYNGYSYWGGVGGNIDQNQILATGRVLPDSRVAVIQTSEWSPDYGSLVVFIEQDGQWLIDEWVEITRNGLPSRG